MDTIYLVHMIIRPTLNKSAQSRSLASLYHSYQENSQPGWAIFTLLVLSLYEPNMKRSWTSMSFVFLLSCIYLTNWIILYLKTLIPIGGGGIIKKNQVSLLILWVSRICVIYIFKMLIEEYTSLVVTLTPTEETDKSQHIMSMDTKAPLSPHYLLNLSSHSPIYFSTHHYPVVPIVKDDHTFSSCSPYGWTLILIR